MYHELSERVTLEHLNKICKVLNCDLTEIMVFEPDNAPDELNTRAGLPKKDAK